MLPTEPHVILAAVDSIAHPARAFPLLRIHRQARVLATPAEAPGPPSGRVSAGIGATREPVGSGKSSVAPGRSISEAGA